MKQGWEYKKLGEVGTFIRGKNIQKTDFVEKGLPCIHYGQLHTVFGVSTDKHLSNIPQELYEQSIIASKNDVLLALTSEDVEGSCRSTAWLGNYDVAVSSDAAVYKHSMNPKFVTYYLRSNSFFIEKSKYARGFKVTHIKTSDIAKIPIPLPPKSTQLAIVSELDKINELIRLKKEQLKDYDNLAQSIFYEMFGDPVENEMGWEVKKLEKVCNITSSKRIFADEYTDKGIPFYRSKEVIERSKGIPISVELFISPERYSEIKEKFGIPVVGDILITAVGTIGKIWSIDTDEKFYFKDGNLVWLKDIDTSLINTIFFKRLLEYLIDEYKKINANGAAYSALTIAKIKLMQCPLPPLPLQQLFAQRIEQIERQKAEVQKTITDLETLLASRMQYWFE
mgnify:CR=1 FL=1